LRRTIATKARRTIETKFDLTQSGRSMAALFEHDPVVAVTSDRSTVPASVAGSAARSHA
jgi:hypothetical protein